jgi:alpha-glucosidase (family GH31 glycosyl hydrolase)
VRLPHGTAWRCGWTGETFEGGAVTERAAPYDRPPVFVRAGAPEPFAVG